MKSYLLILMACMSFQALAQDAVQDSSGEGYWVIESNIKTPREAVISFYNSSQVLIYKEKVSGRRINVEKRKHRRQLNAALREALLAWNREKILREDLNLVWSRIM